MPSFYPHHLPWQLPLTPPDHFGPYSDSQEAFCSSSATMYGLNNLDLRYSMDLQDKYGYNKPVSVQRELYTDHASAPSNGFSAALSRREHYGTGVPVLPPIRIPENTVDDSIVQHQSVSTSHAAQPQAQPKEEKVAGGVAAHLDYQIEQMIEFVAEMAQGMYDLFESRFCLADIDISRSVQPSASVTPAFRKYVSQILTSTRLPSSTILLALHYLATRMTMLSTQGVYTSSTGHLYHMLTTSLMLASKFLDDNTFQNRSWAEVSHISTSDLNKHEMEWLVDIQWNLHIDSNDPQGFSAWLKQWERWQAKKVEMSMEALKLTAVDTALRLQLTSHKYMPPTPVYTPSYSEPMFSRSSKDRSPTHWPQWPPIRTISPPSAGHSGPATPDWYGKQGMMGYGQPPSTYSSRPLPPLNVLASSNQSSYYGSYQQHYNPSPWNTHNTPCGCGQCSILHDRYSMVHNYGIQPVAG